jgi:protein involved in polysaccharide export with SLBB domain
MRLALVLLGSVVVALASAGCASDPSGAASDGAFVTISGEVRNPGRIRVPTSGPPLSLLGAIGACGDLTPAADRAHLRVSRTGEKGRIQVGVNIDDILGGRRPDFALRADDHVQVPRRAN